MNDDLFLPGLPVAEIRAAYMNAPGNEIESGKFTSPESSAALVANAFGYFLRHPTSLPALPGTLNCDWPATSISLETIVRFPWAGGRHPCLDVLVTTSSALIGVESKRYEPFRTKNDGELSEAYWRLVWGDKMKGYERCRDIARDDGKRFVRLDVAQLVKHAFALRTAANGVWKDKKPILFYLFAEPEHWPDGKSVPEADRLRHRVELSSFSELVAGDEVLFRSCSYRELLETWKASSNHLVSAHAGALTQRFLS
jgi:hypothetical protein